MTAAEMKSIVENYVRAYNAFDVDGMLVNLHRDVIFKNIADGEVTVDIAGVEAFKKQVAQATRLFIEREQKIIEFDFNDEGCAIRIDYRATLAADLSNNLKAGDQIELKGKSTFRFTNNKISEIQDIS